MSGAASSRRPEAMRKRARNAAASGSVDALSGFCDERKVATQQRALGEDGERCAGVGKRPDDSRHQGVAAFRTLVGIGVCAECDGLTPP